MTSPKFFPIKTNTACVNKWTWSTLYFYSGQTSSCHRVPSGLIDSSNFEEFHNTEQKLLDRQDMLQGVWPTRTDNVVGCNYCKNIEDVGGVSDRILSNTFTDITPDELQYDASAIKVSPKILEIFFDNICNFACVYCHAKYSSKINQEINKFGLINFKGKLLQEKTTKHAEHNIFLEKFWEWFSKNHSTLTHLNVLGGEPFYQKEIDKLLEFLDKNPSPNLHLSVTSNLGIKHEKFTNYINNIKKLVAKRKLKRFDLNASIDCFGAEAEYIRYGLDLNEWCKNFEYAVREKWIYLNVNSVLCLLNIKTMPDLLEYLNKFKKNRRINNLTITCYKPDFLHPGIIGNNYFDKDFDRVLQLLSVDRENDKNLADYMLGQKKQIGLMPRNQDLLQQAFYYLDEIDKRRNTNWKKTFPWLYDLSKDNVV